MEERLLRDVHGTRQCYTSKGCRCGPCVEANAKYMQAYREGKRNGPTPRRKKEREHGTRSSYVAGCRCDQCSYANREYQRMYMNLRRKGIPWNDPGMNGILP